MMCNYCGHEHGIIGDVVCPILNRFPQVAKENTYKPKRKLAWVTKEIHLPVKKYIFEISLQKRKIKLNLEIAKLLCPTTVFQNTEHSDDKTNSHKYNFDYLKVLIKAVVDSEDKSKPYFDSEIMNFLAENNIIIQETVISKARFRQGIKDSTSRREIFQGKILPRTA